MRNLRYISVQPRTIFYAWQIETFINNFIQNGINANHIDVLVSYSNDPKDLTNKQENIDIFRALADKYNNVRFFFYRDTRRTRFYISSIRPNILKQHFQLHPELEQDAIFYHDADIVFTTQPNFNVFLEDDIWYLSNTIDYIGAKYIESKGQDVYNTMCRIVGLDFNTPRLNEDSSGGAQYILKNIDSKFWDKVEKNSEELYKVITKLNSEKIIQDPKYHPLQIWCADMWSLLWNGWLFNHETKIDPYLDFCWPTQPIEYWDNKVIYHNAGVVEPGDMFYKGMFMNKTPYNTLNIYNAKLCSYNYFEEILKVKDKTVIK